MAINFVERLKQKYLEIKYGKEALQAMKIVIDGGRVYKVIPDFKSPCAGKPGYYNWIQLGGRK